MSDPAWELVEAGRFDDALVLLRAEASDASLRGDEVERAIAWNRLGVAAKHAGRYDEAAAAYAEALPVAEARRSCDPGFLATLLHNLAGLEHSRRDDAAAEPLARRGLALRRESCPGDRFGLASDCAALGAILEGLEGWDEAEALYREALAVWEADGDGYEVAMTLNGLAAVVRFGGRPDDAEPLFRRALALMSAERGDGHPDTATARNNLAMLLNATGREAEALPMLEQAAADLDTVLGADHPATVDVRANRDRIAASLAGGR